MENLSFNFTPDLFPLIFCVAALIQFVKKIPLLSRYSDWLPLLSCLLGIGVAYLQHIGNPLVSGIVIGVIASGSYELLKGIPSIPLPSPDKNPPDDAKTAPPSNQPSMN